jgi:glycosyltransferase involved in cell wall biosynthesis
MTFHPGINIEQWPMREDREPGERFKLLFVGGDGPRKGLATLVDAFERSLHAHCDLDIATQAGYLPPELKERITCLPHTRLLLDLQSGSDELKALYRECDAFVLPTNGDSSSWVGIEALATGIPVIITNVGGIPEIIIDGETGLNIPPNDPDALASAVERLRTSPALRHKLICQGRAHIEANFNANINTPRMLTAIKDLIDRKQVR